MGDDNIAVSTMSIGRVQVTVKIEELNQADLSFYSENPRVYSALNCGEKAPSQDEIEEHMKRMDHVRELAEDIKANDGLIEEIIVRDRDFVVLEGNSRLAAYRILAEKNAVKWAKIRCKVLPNDIGEDLIFKLIGQYHIKGKKPWDAYEQASYLYRRTQTTKLHIETVADELGIDKNKAKNMIRAVELMQEKKENDNHKFSYYFELIKDPKLREVMDESDNFTERVVSQIKNGEIEKAEDIRLLGKIAKVKDKKSKQVIKAYSTGEQSIYSAYDEMESTGKLVPAVQQLKKFKNYISEESFETSVTSSIQTFNSAKFELMQIERRINQLKKKWDKK